MSESPFVGEPSNPARRATFSRWRALGVAAGAAILIFGVMVHTQSNPARGQTDSPPRTDQTSPATAPASPSDFLAEIRRSLTQQQDRMIKLAGQMLEFDDASSRARDQVGSQKILAEAAKARYENATLAREIAEIKVAEYVDGQYKQDLATVVGELKIAEEEIKILPEQTKDAEARLAKIKDASKGSAVDLSIEADAEAKVVAARLVEQRARFVLEQAENKKKILVEYTKSKTIRELRSGVQKAHSDELARKATWDLENTKVKRLERDALEKAPPPEVRHVLVLLDQGIALQDRIRGMIEQVTRERNLTDSRKKEMRDSVSQLRAIVEEADGTRAAFQFDKLKPRIHEAAGRPDTPKK